MYEYWQPGKYEAEKEAAWQERRGRHGMQKLVCHALSQEHSVHVVPKTREFSEKLQQF